MNDFWQDPNTGTWYIEKSAASNKVLRKMVTALSKSKPELLDVAGNMQNLDKRQLNKVLRSVGVDDRAISRPRSLGQREMVMLSPAARYITRPHRKFRHIKDPYAVEHAPYLKELEEERASLGKAIQDARKNKKMLRMGWRIEEKNAYDQMIPKLRNYKNKIIDMTHL